MTGIFCWELLRIFRGRRRRRRGVRDEKGGERLRPGPETKFITRDEAGQVISIKGRGWSVGHVGI